MESEHTLSNQQCCVPLSLCCLFRASEGSSLPTLQGSKSGHSPKHHPCNSSSWFQSLSGALHSSTRTTRSKHVRGVCTPSKGHVKCDLNRQVHYFSILCDCSSHHSQIFRLSLDGEENHKSPHWRGQGTSRSSFNASKTLFSFQRTLGSVTH